MSFDGAGSGAMTETTGRTPGDGVDLALVRRASHVDWLLLDVDGVLTDGRLYLSGAGETMKVFHVRDGLAIKLAREAGLRVGLLSARRSAALSRRAADLGVDAVMAGREDKARAFDLFLAQRHTRAERVAYIGDDLPDLPVLRRARLSFAPADAAPEVRAAVDRVLSLPGGHGAVREAVEWLLRARGAWESLAARWSGGRG